ncbi:cell wall-binding repeat-containing protein [Desulfitobacterium chlororespirans]|uniref:Putative cell wall-binding protein n=1 Tax=Desulfitobacterium chlororespirans DSM 11544 TaxID=1121395 RepID=A0A1M7TVN7_9FIRM|nr:cell wall-binding repeat-containing protein [Desulfitobacterium chlororespirans]SHN74786.1 Putative cell wall-binding protein [Desulfitobacterium chlororespirans DSM 11544]
MRKLKLTVILCLILFMSIAPLNTYALSSPSALTNSPGLNDGSTEAGERISGEDRYETAAAIARAGWDTAYYAVIASGESFPDALCAASLAKQHNAPILLTSKNALAKATEEILLAKGVKKVMVIGGPGVISENVIKSIEDLGIDAARIAGISRYETSLQVAQAMGDFKEAVIASGEHFQDVLSIASIAAKKGMPILFTPQDSISSDLKNLLEQKVENTYVLGSNDAISDAVYKQLPSPRRLTGSDWYELNVAVIEAFAPELDMSLCFVAAGSSYPDTLAGSALAATYGSPVLLVGSPLRDVTSSFLQKNSTHIQKIVAFGGTGALADNLLYTIAAKAGVADNEKGNEIGNETGSENREPAVSNLKATAVSAKQIYLAWDNNSEASSYTVYRAASSDGRYMELATAFSPYYIDTSLEPGTTYYYKVKAHTKSESGPYSKIVSGTTPPVSENLSQPQNVAVSAANTHQANISWDAVSHADYYDVYRAVSANGAFVRIATVEHPYYLDADLTSGMSYYYRIQAVAASSVSPYSAVVQAGNGTEPGNPVSTGTATDTASDTNVLSIPVNFELIPLQNGQVYLSWNKVDKASYYTIYKSTSKTGPYSVLGTVVNTHYYDDNLLSKTAYYYKIQACNETSKGSQSEAKYVITK